MILVVSADDISLHATLAEAASEMEPPEVRNNEYTVYRSNGEKLGVCLVREGEAENVLVIEPPTKTMAVEELRTHLVRFFDARGQPVARDESLEHLVERLADYNSRPDRYGTSFKVFIVEENGLIYFRSRSGYSPSLGRFLNRMPWSFVGGTVVQEPGHHRIPLSWGGEPNPEEPLTETGETRTEKNPTHTAVTNFMNRVLRRIQNERNREADAPRCCAPEPRNIPEDPVPLKNAGLPMHEP